MDFYAVFDQIVVLLQQRGRASYRALKVQFQLDDDQFAALKEELVEVQQLAVEQDSRMLVWTGGPATSSPSAPAPVSTQSPAPHTYTPPYLVEQILSNRHVLEGERKQVTVLFADIKGSTELIAGLDPEEARTLLDPALRLMMHAVHRYEGTVNQVLGDGIMALFGAPLAHEDHAVRACYAALAMQEAMRRYTEEVRHTHGVEVQLRVGLNSGTVVVRAIGDDLHMDYAAVGQTTHLAARMEQLAPPGSVRLTVETLRLAEGFVQVTALGLVPVKGLAEPVAVWELVGGTALRRRLQAAVARGAAGLALAEQGVEQEAARGIPRSLVPVVTLLSEAYLLAGRLEEARQRAVQALDLACQSQLRGHQAWALWLLGESAARQASPEFEPAASHYRQTLTLTEELGMRPLQAHCHRGLGTLYARTGQPQQARAALAAAIDLYRDMEMTWWLPQAEAVLAQVEG